MSTQNDGGPAFPGPEELQGCGNQTWVDGPNGPELISCNQGMSLRDYFAAAALQGWLASYGHETPHPCTEKEGGNITARLSYMMADSMLAERAKGGAQ